MHLLRRAAKKCSFCQYSGLMAPRGRPWLARVNQLIGRMRQAGIVDHIISKNLPAGAEALAGSFLGAAVDRVGGASDAGGGENVPLGPVHLLVATVGLLAGLAAAAASLAAEVATERKKKIPSLPSKTQGIQMSNL